MMIRHICFPLVVLGILPVLLGAADPSPGSELDVSIRKVEFGFGGMYKVGDWTPLFVTLEANRPAKVRIVIEAPDPDDNITHLPSPEHELSGQGAVRLPGFFKVGRLAGDLHVHVYESDRLVASSRNHAGSASGTSFRPALMQSVSLWATLGGPGGFDQAAKPDASAPSASEPNKPTPSQVESSRDLREAPLESAAELPEEWRGYQTLDGLLVCCSARGDDDKPLLAGLTDRQDAAIREWVQAGGHLMLSVGRDVPAYQSSLLAKWVPVPILGQSQTRQLNRLERYLGRPAPIFAKFDGTVPVARIGQVSAKPLVEELEGPFLVQVPHGLGLVTLIGADLDRPPLANWDGLKTIYARLLLNEREQTGRAAQTAEPSQLAQLGVGDLTSQLQASQETFQDMFRASVWGVMGLILAYLLVIGPLDYLVVHRLLRRPQLTWITFPAMVLIVGSVSVLAATWSNGGRLKLNQLNIVDIDTDSDFLRGQTWVTFYSPQTRRGRVTINPSTQTWEPRAAGKEGKAGAAAVADQSQASLLSWYGIPENSIGGMYRSGGVQIVERGYRFNPESTAAEDLPLQAWSTKNVTGQWHQIRDGVVKSALESVGVGKLSGQITHELPGDIEDCMLAFGNRVFFPMQRSKGVRLPILPPHQAWELGRQLQADQRELKGFLTAVKTKKADRTNSAIAAVELRLQQTPYDPLNRNRLDIVRMLTFHQAAGGTSYTGLRHDAHGELDLSHQLRLGRAVLFGRIRSTASEVKLDGDSITEPEQETYVRLVLPVKRTEANEFFHLPKIEPEEK